MRSIFVVALAVGACARPAPREMAPRSRAEAPRVAVRPDASAAPPAEGESTPDAAAPPDAAPDVAQEASPLATLFDGDPSGGAVALVESRCGPWCLRYPKGWLSTDDGGFVYAWFFRGEGQFGTAEVMRSPLAKLDDAGIALRLRYAGGENVTWSAPVAGAVGADHVPALVAEGKGRSRGRKARFWYAYVDLGRRKDLVLAYVVEGEPAGRTDETIAVVRSVRVADGTPTPR